jgi:Fur family ferric uptake transcriptional regulator/Fur family peroxide stress response transcriptional regulator
MDADDNRLEAALHNRGQRVTPQRIAIARALRRLDRHASAEDVASAVSREMPGVSVPTVYATLELLTDLGLARRLTAAPGAVLYDPHTDDHHHAVCTNCGRIEDVRVTVDSEAALRSARGRGFKPDRVELIVSGLCRDCRAA